MSARRGWLGEPQPSREWGESHYSREADRIEKRGKPRTANDGKSSIGARVGIQGRCAEWQDLSATFGRPPLARAVCQIFPWCTVRWARLPGRRARYPNSRPPVG